MSKLRVLVVFGGESSEHDVSVKSAHNIYAALDNNKYTVHLCFIDKVGRWWLVPSIDSFHVGCPQLIPMLGQRRFMTLHDQNELLIDAIFPVLHGRGGEDGTIQGVAEMLHIPCVGPSLISAAVTMDKDMTKRLLRDAGIPVVPWVVIQRGMKTSFSTISEQLGKVIFVKPANTGSSVGVHKVINATEFHSALTDAWQYDGMALVERAIVARELEVAVLGNEHPEVSGVGEIVPGEEFYSYDDKYAATSQAQAVVPADIDPDIEEMVRSYALASYRAVNGHGMARVDFFLDREDQQIYLNEINSIPGFTNISMYPKLWHQTGLTYGQLIDRLIQFALEK